MTKDLDPALAEARKMYFEECAEMLDDAALRLANLPKSLDQTDAEEINAIFRAVHSAKGGGGAWGLTDLASFAHTFEALLGMIRDGAVKITSEIADLLIEANDILATLLQNAAQNSETDVSEWTDIADALKAAAGTETPAKAKKPKQKSQPKSKPAAKKKPTVYQLAPIIDNSSAGDLKKSLLDAIGKSSELDIDGANVERVTTLGIQVLLSAADEVASKGGAIHLKNPSPLLKECLGDLGVADYFGK